MKTLLVFLVIVSLLGLAIPVSIVAQSGRNRAKTTSSGKSQSDGDTTSSPVTAENKSVSTPPVTSQPAAEDSKTVAASSSDPNDVVKLDSTLVSVPLTVSDHSGRYLPSLSKKDFEIYEDGIKQQVAFFTSDEVPFHVILLIDTSGSTTESGREIKTAAEGFVGELHQDDQVMVMSFASRVNIETEFTNDRQRLTGAIERIRWGGSTKLYDAVYQSVVTELKNIQGRKAIVLLTDGEDTSSSRATYHQAIDASVESGALVFVARYPGDDWSMGGPAVAEDEVQAEPDQHSRTRGIPGRGRCRTLAASLYFRDHHNREMAAVKRDRADARKVIFSAIWSMKQAARCSTQPSIAI